MGARDTSRAPSRDRPYIHPSNAVSNTVDDRRRTRATGTYIGVRELEYEGAALGRHRDGSSAPSRDAMSTSTTTTTTTTTTATTWRRANARGTGGTDARTCARRGGRATARARVGREKARRASSGCALGVDARTRDGTMTTADARALVESFARVSLAPTGASPIERAPRLSEALGGGAEIFIKRDDVYGTITGGNKTRKLEYLLAEALDANAERVVTQGATQSNHARQTAAACARLGLKCHVLLEDRTKRVDQNYTANGNVLLNSLFGATMEYRPGDQGLNMNDEMLASCESFREKGERVYGIVGGGSCPTGALGYVRAAIEILEQADAMGLEFDYIVHATGSAGTQAGLVTGLHAVGSKTKLLGFGVRAPKDVQETNVHNLAVKTCEKLGIDPVDRADVVADTNYVGDGYGFPADSTIEAIREFASLEGILLDPVYSGKGGAGLIDYCRKGLFAPGTKVLFLHTGGSTSLHGYLDSFAQ